MQYPNAKTMLIGVFATMMVLLTFQSAFAAAPTASDASITPVAATTADDLTVAVLCRGDTASYSVNYSISDVAMSGITGANLQNNTKATFVTVPNSITEKGDRIQATVRCVDLNGVASAAITSNEVIIQNSKPTLQDTTITIPSDENSASVSLPANDADGDAITYTLLSENASRADCSVSGTTLSVSRVGSYTGQSTCQVRAAETADLSSFTTATFTIQVSPENPLRIKKAYAVINGEKDSFKDGGDFEVQPGDDLKINRSSGRVLRNNLENLAWPDIANAVDGECFRTVEAHAFPAFPRLEHQGQNPHAHEIAAVDAFEGLRDDRLDAQQHGSLGGPVPR